MTKSKDLPLGNHTQQNLYDKDFVAWADQQALLLEQERWSELDLVNLIEEVRDLGNWHRDALESHLTRLLMHLLKWQYQSERCSSSWLGTIKEARRQLARLVRKHPVLALHAHKVWLGCYLDAREDAADETELPIDTFSWECPYTLEQVLERDFLPEDSGSNELAPRSNFET